MLLRADQILPRRAERTTLPINCNLMHCVARVCALELASELDKLPALLSSLATAYGDIVLPK
jgi:hypothetical protein